MKQYVVSIAMLLAVSASMCAMERALQDTLNSIALVALSNTGTIQKNETEFAIYYIVQKPDGYILAIKYLEGQHKGHISCTSYVEMKAKVVEVVHVGRGGFSDTMYQLQLPYYIETKLPDYYFTLIERKYQEQCDKQ